LWGKSLAKRVKELLSAYGLENTYVADDNEIQDMGNYELQQILKSQKYVIIVASKGLFTDIIALAELSIIGKLWDKREINVFILQDKKQMLDIPHWAQWMKKANILKVQDDTDILAAVAIILEKYWGDKILCSMAQLKCMENVKDIG